MNRAWGPAEGRGIVCGGAPPSAAVTPLPPGWTDLRRRLASVPAVGKRSLIPDRVGDSRLLYAGEDAGSIDGISVANAVRHFLDSPG